jgi:thiamine biosynthesis lipoprotein
MFSSLKGSARSPIAPWRLLPLAVLALLAGFVAWKSRPAPRHLQGSAMGCRWTLEWRGDAPPPAELRAEVALTLEKWEQILSQWRPSSDLSRHNLGEPATPELLRVLADAEVIRQQSGGAFDPHILEKVHAAGFGPEGQGIDLSSIGKGFGVDRVVERLRGLGMRDFVFALAGEVRATGGQWPVDIERPVPGGGGGVLRTVMLKDRAIATSGNYIQYRETAEGMVTHIIDPRTGKSVIRPPCSVTVIAADSANASSWATALFVLGPEFTGYPEGLGVSWQ